MSKKGSGPNSKASGGPRRAGRPLLHGREAHVAVVRYVEDQQRRTGLSINTILEHGLFVQAMSGSPEDRLDGPDGPTVLHELRGSSLRRRYFEAKAWLEAHLDSA